MIKFTHKHLNLLAVALVSLAAGAGASAIATAGAATTTHPHATSSARRDRGGPLARLARRTAAGSLVVHTKDGYVTVTLARGSVQSVSGQQLTLQEGTPKAPYRTVTLTLPAPTHVRDNGRKATLSGVSSGQRATVVIAPHRSLVVAHTPKRS